MSRRNKTRKHRDWRQSSGIEQEGQGLFDSIGWPRLPNLVASVIPGTSAYNVQDAQRRAVAAREAASSSGALKNELPTLPTTTSLPSSVPLEEDDDKRLSLQTPPTRVERPGGKRNSRSRSGRKSRRRKSGKSKKTRGCK